MEVSSASTLAKIEANRRNAHRSTGPRTPAGKAVSSKNATKHGLLSREVMLGDEDDWALVRPRKGLYAVLQPVGELDELLVDRVVSTAWRLRRVLTVEVDLLDDERRRPGMWDMGSLLMHSAVNGDSFSKLSRYETALERSLYRALHELQRLQAARAGQLVPLPVAVDVDVSGIGPGA